MMKRQYIILLLLCLIIAVDGFPQSKEEKFYYAKDRKIYLCEVENKFIISCNTKDLSVIKKVLLQDKESKIKWINDSICMVQMDASRSKTVKENIRALQGIKSLHPMYFATNGRGSEMGVVDEFLIKPKADISLEEIDKLHRKYQVTVKEITRLHQLLSVPAHEDALAIANLYQESGLVVYSHPNFIGKANLHQTIPDDPYFVNQFYLHNTGQTMPNGHFGYAGADINAPEAWDVTKGSSNIIVAVIDDGVTSDHPDLPDNRQVRLAGSNFASGDPDDPSPVFNDNHGNACAGIIAASHNNEGIAGIAPNCKIMPVRIPFEYYFVQKIAAAITFAKDNGADIISNSWASDSVQAIVDAIEDATLTGRNGKGCVMVFSVGNSANIAAGDSGYIEFPANVEVPGVIAVGASDRYNHAANYSPTSNIYIETSNQIIDIVAPSHRAYSFQDKYQDETLEVWTIDVPGNAGDNPVKSTDGGGLPIQGSSMPYSGTNYLAYTGYFGGTSAACAQVAGVAALMLSRNPFLTQQEVADIIESTARKAGPYDYQITWGIPNGTWNPRMGHGVLDAYAAVQEACATNPDFTNQTVTTDTTVNSCDDINVQNVTVEDGAKLKLNAVGDVTINGDFEVELGSELEINVP